MGIRIESVSTALREGKGHRGDSRGLAAASAEACLRGASAAESDRVGLLVYAGVYRDDNVVEPAQAPFAQRAIGAYAGVGSGRADAAFSFDVDHLLAGVEIADGMLRSHAFGRAVVVAVDGGTPATEPGEVRVDPAAGAMLLARGAEGEGFCAYRSDVFPAHRDLRQGTLVWSEGDGKGHRPGHTMEVVQGPGYLEACVTCAIKAIAAFAEDVSLSLREGCLIVPSQFPRGFARALGRRLELPPERVVDVSLGDQSVLTAGPIVAMEQAMRDGRWAAARNVLFVTVAPGIVVETALYRGSA
jgi:3-oxoacyl-[acyl-carrier-protein] synthase-3